MRVNKDEVNEFDRSKILENIRLCTNYVLEYFTSYLDISPEEEKASDNKQRADICVENYRKGSDDNAKPMQQNNSRNYVENLNSEERALLEELIANPKPFITPAIAAKVTGQNPHSIRLMARQKPELLGYPVSVCGNRTLIPKWSFIKFWFGIDEQDCKLAV